MTGVNDLPGFTGSIFDQFENMIKIMQAEISTLTHMADNRPLNMDEFYYNVGFMDAAKAALAWRDGADTITEQFNISEEALTEEMKKRGWME